MKTKPIEPGQIYQLEDGQQARVIKVSGRGRNRAAYCSVSAEDGRGVSQWLSCRELKRGELLESSN